MEQNLNNQAPPLPPAHEVNASQTAGTETHNPKPKRHIPWPKILVAGIVILITLITFGLITYLLMGNRSTNDEIEEISPKTPVEKEDPTADWETYENLEFGFKIKHPKDWIIENQSYETDSNQFIEFNLQAPSRDADRITGNFLFYTRALKWDPNSKTLIANDAYGESGEIFFQQGKFIGDSAVRANVSDNFIINSPEHKIAEQIISTFKFKSSEPKTTIDTSDWETYTGKGFTFKYPSNLNATDYDFDTPYRVFVSNDDFQLVIYPGGIEGEANLENYVENVETVGARNFESIVISGEEAVRYNVDAKGEETTAIIVIHNGLGYTLTTSYTNPDQLKYLDQILSTFQFTE